MLLQRLFADNYPVFLAPMAGVTDAPFRSMVNRFGVSASVSEMVSSEALVRSSSKTFKRLIGDISPKIVQIMGASPENMVESARINEEMGADIIDINMGCPVKKIVSSGGGSALLQDENLSVDIAARVVKSVNVPVTVKLRLGWDSNSINFLSLARKLEEVGVRMLTIHCRTRSQMYSGKSDWQQLAPLRELIKIPYLCNGDILTADDAIVALEQSGAYGVMIGRAALGRVWLPNQIERFINHREIVPTPTLQEQLDLVITHFHKVIEFYGNIHGMRMFRKHFCWYSTGMHGASTFRETINQMEDIATIEEYVRDFYSKNIMRNTKEA